MFVLQSISDYGNRFLNAFLDSELIFLIFIYSNLRAFLAQAFIKNTKFLKNFSFEK
jgi:hypothetical protein